MGFRVLLLFLALLPMNDANHNADCRLVRPSYIPPSLWPPGPPHRLPPCVNYDVLLPEVTSLTDRLPQSFVELGLSDILTDLEELNDTCLTHLKGPVGPIHCGNETAQHWTRQGLVIHLVYNVTVGGNETFFAFPSPQFDNLTASDTLEGPVQSLQDDVEGFPAIYPNTTAEAVPSLVQDFTELLDSFNCSTNGPNCNLTRGEEHVVELDDRWTLVARQGIEYEPLGMRRAIWGRFLIMAYRRMRGMFQCIIS